jgi:hypothetical protein
MRSTCSLFLCVFSPTVASQRLDKLIPAATNVYTTEEQLDAMFSARSASYHILDM